MSKTNSTFFSGTSGSETSIELTEGLKKEDTIAANSKNKNTETKLIITNTNLHKAKQLQHSINSPYYIKGKSYIYDSLEMCEKMIKKYSTHGDIINSTKERVYIPELTGYWVNSKNGKAKKTNYYIITYSKKGSHLYPVRPNEEDNK